MEINIAQVLFQALNFGAVLYILNRFLYKPVKDILDQRERKVNEGLAAAERNLKAESEVEKYKKEELVKARREAAKIIADAKAEAKKQEEQILEKAKAEAKKEALRLVESAQNTIEEEKRAMRASLKELVIATTSKLLSESLTNAEIEKITSKMVKSIK